MSKVNLDKIPFWAADEALSSVQLSAKVTENPKIIYTDDPLLALDNKIKRISLAAAPPLYKEDKDASNDWIKWGMANDMSNYYIGLMEKSATHAAILDTKAKMVGGNGISQHNLSNEGIQWLKNIGSLGEGINETVFNSAYSYEMYGGFFWNVVWNDTYTKICSIQYISPNNIRIGAINKEDPTAPRDYFYCEDWKKYRQKGVIKYPGFSSIERRSPIKTKMGRYNNPNQILYVKRKAEGYVHYGKPIYTPGCHWATMEWEISQWHLSNIQNGFSPSLLINFITGGKPSPEQEDTAMRMLKDQYSGSAAAGEPIIIYSKSKDSMPTITPLELNASHERFVELNKQITSGILTAHQTGNTPALFNIASEGKSGIFDKNSSIAEMQTFQSFYVAPHQLKIEEALNMLAYHSGIKDKFELNRYELDYDVNLSMDDMLSLFPNPPKEQQYQILISMGYRDEEAKKLVESGGDKPQVAPAKPIEQSIEAMIQKKMDIHNKK